MRRPGALLVTHLSGQVTGSNCCGKLEGANCNLGVEDPFASERARHEMAAASARARAAQEGVDLEVVDGRNLFGLVLSYHRQVQAHGWPGLKNALRGYLGIYPVPCVIVKGRVEPLGLADGAA